CGICRSVLAGEQHSGVRAVVDDERAPGVGAIGVQAVCGAVVGLLLTMGDGLVVAVRSVWGHGHQLEHLQVVGGHVGAVAQQVDRVLAKSEADHCRGLTLT
ncbi:MAG: hypothetical protein OWU32_14115, partial [Firmicutes bacterium]|nr:hypothetical protein [Bacillota bacterium]